MSQILSCFTVSILQNLNFAQIVVSGTCGVHVSLTTVQDTWRKQTVPFVRKPMTYTGVVGRHPGQYSYGARIAAMHKRCLLPLHLFRLIPLSMHLDLLGGILCSMRNGIPGAVYTHLIFSIMTLYNINVMHTSVRKMKTSAQQKLYIPTGLQCFIL